MSILTIIFHAVKRSMRMSDGLSSWAAVFFLICGTRSAVRSTIIVRMVGYRLGIHPDMTHQRLSTGDRGAAGQVGPARGRPREGLEVRIVVGGDRHGGRPLLVGLWKGWAVRSQWMERWMEWGEQGI